jgi:hypothetical protein
MIKEKGVGFAPCNYVDDAYLPCVIRLVQQAMEKEDKWSREANALRKVFLDLDSDKQA